jgi:hypothetical protein
MKHDYHETDSPTQVGTDSRISEPPPVERRPVLVALGGELLATPIPLERRKSHSAARSTPTFVSTTPKRHACMPASARKSTLIRANRFSGSPISIRPTAPS